MDVHIVIPFASTDDQRIAVRDWITARYRAEHPGWPVTVAGCDGPWSKGAAVNGVAEALDAEVTIVADADSFVAARALRNAVDRVEVLGWAMPHSRVQRMNAAESAEVMAGGSPPRRAGTPALPGGGIVVLHRRARRMLRGVIFDPRFVGWGLEDRTLSLLMGRLLGHYPSTAINQRLFHLWHPPAEAHRRPSKANRLLFRRYRKAADNAALLDIVEEVAHAGRR